MATERGVPRESGFEGQRGLTAEIVQDWRKQKLYPWRMHTGSHTHQNPGNKAVSSKETRSEFPFSIGGCPVKIRGAVAHCESRDTGSRGSVENSLAWVL